MAARAKPPVRPFGILLSITHHTGPSTTTNTTTERELSTMPTTEQIEAETAELHCQPAFVTPDSALSTAAPKHKRRRKHTWIKGSKALASLALAHPEAANPNPCNIL